MSTQMAHKPHNGIEIEKYLNVVNFMRSLFLFHELSVIIVFLRQNTDRCCKKYVSTILEKTGRHFARFGTLYENATLSC